MNTQKLEQVPIDKLVPYARNARTHSKEQIAQLRASLREFGFVSPAVIDADYNILVGHGRISAFFFSTNTDWSPSLYSIKPNLILIVTYIQEKPMKLHSLLINANFSKKPHSTPFYRLYFCSFPSISYPSSLHSVGNHIRS